MSEIWWSLKGTDQHCHLYGPGHWAHWIQHKLSVREPGSVIPVTASLDDDGVVTLEGSGLSMLRWNHRPALMQAALFESGGLAQWQPRWHLLLVPTGDRVAGTCNAFSLAALDERRRCSVTRTTNPDHLVPRAPAPTNVPPLRVTTLYAAGMPESRRANKFRK
ncbi:MULTISPECIES: hypothetical protein [unclassified Mycobacterium]|uniref:hypothetical protein n=1 Tax=unclassified Mycobacterium TaxID=2642494 RepID=UPI000AD56D36|nr:MULTISPECIES: hypothetical protein [unclassified Mycobacterium]